MGGQLAANYPDDALQYLREAINRGYKDADGVTADPDLLSGERCVEQWDGT